MTRERNSARSAAIRAEDQDEIIHPDFGAGGSSARNSPSPPCCNRRRSVTGALVHGELELRVLRQLAAAPVDGAKAWGPTVGRAWNHGPFELRLLFFFLYLFSFPGRAERASRRGRVPDVHRAAARQRPGRGRLRDRGGREHRGRLLPGRQRRVGRPSGRGTGARVGAHPGAACADGGLRRSRRPARVRSRRESGRRRKLGPGVPAGASVAAAAGRLGRPR
jgi:hypothetical protein